MKHHEKHEREGRKSGGGVDESAEDLRMKNEARTNAKKIDGEAEERKHGGRTRKERKRGGHAGHGGEMEKRPERKRGGHVKHEHAKHVGYVSGEHAKHHAGRKPRRSGGRAACEASPFTSAHKGVQPSGHKTESVE
jgi:hypothetical protein